MGGRGEHIVARDEPVAYFRRLPPRLRLRRRAPVSAGAGVSPLSSVPGAALEAAVESAVVGAPLEAAVESPVVGAALEAAVESPVVGAALEAAVESQVVGAAAEAAGDPPVVAGSSTHSAPQRQQVSSCRDIGASHVRHTRGKCRSRIAQRSRTGELPGPIWGVICIW
jgi:hypothetical protein